MALTNLSQVTTSGIANLANINLNNLTGVAATFTGNVTVGGTLTYDDVTNVDSVGLITARSGVNITGGDLTLPDSIIHAGDTNTKIRFPADDTVTVETGGAERLRIFSNGNFSIGAASAAGNKVYFQSTSGAAQYIASGGSNNRDLLVGSSAGEFIRVTSTGNIGIGTDNPAKTLTLFGASSSSFRLSKSGVLAYDHTFDGSTYTIANNNGSAGIPIIFGTKTSGGESLRIGASGEIGIGGTNYGASGQVFTSGGNGSAPSWTTLSTGSDKLSEGNTEAEVVDTGSDGHFKVTTEGTERLRVNSRGDLVIGTTVEQSAYTNIHVHGDYTRIKLTDQFSGTGNTDGLDILCSGGSAYLKFHENGHMYFATAGTNRLQLNNTGDVHVLTTGAKLGVGLNNPANALHIKNDSPTIRLESSASSYVGRNTIGQYQNGLFIECDNDNAISNSYTVFTVDGSEKLRIINSGKVGIGTVNPTTLLHVYSADYPAATITRNHAVNYPALLLNNTSGKGCHLEAVSDDPGGGFRIMTVVGTGRTERLRIDGAGRMGLNQTSVNSSRMMEIKQPSSYTSALRINTAGSAGNPGYVEWFTGVSNWKLGVDNNNDALIFRRDGTKNVRIDSAGGINIENDVGKFSCGTSADLQIYHDGSNSYINDQGTGGLYIRGGGTIGFRDSENSMANLANFYSGGACKFYYNGSSRLETVSNGIKVTNRIFLGNSTNGGFDYNSTADTLEVLTTNGSTHSEWTSDAYVPGTNAGKKLGYHNKRWGSIYTSGVAFDGNTDAAATLLDDYEEGTYTPALYAGTGTTEASYSWRYGNYVKIGEVVHLWGAIGINGAMPSCSSCYIGNFPFNQAFDSNNFFHYIQLFGYTWASGYGDSSSDTRLFLQTANGHANKAIIVSGSAKTGATNAMIGDNQRFTFYVSYPAG